jgi:hypothetical protein
LFFAYFEYFFVTFIFIGTFFRNVKVVQVTIQIKKFVMIPTIGVVSLFVASGIASFVGLEASTFHGNAFRF